ncbi:hypothetical protein N7462_010007 [Penicillium macrosclerotiorum]|uniref:uncharacterized protein n=1 Tax=Penicillium macrosclerotiorum TaxID=303699 RepID=UPI002549A522|nr:uncharacterized protein N7462_010007 [Penicillium macrosclerotiorum]KAJ5668937.1 hypothetical protein N7462_010007 [Penicillium macrosclerotiorum]
MVRELKYTEKKLLKKHNFYDYKSDGGHRENRVSQQYHLNKEKEEYRKYNTLCGSLRKLANRLAKMDPEDPLRRKLESDMMDKLYRMGILKKSREQGAALSEVEHLGVANFARRRLPNVMVAKSFIGTVTDAIRAIQTGDVRVGTEIITDPAFLVTRNMEDYINWVDTSKYRLASKQYRGQQDDYDTLQA